MQQTLKEIADVLVALEKGTAEIEKTLATLLQWLDMPKRVNGWHASPEVIQDPKSRPTDLAS